MILRRFIFTVVITLSLGLMATQANAEYTTKNSYDYMKDDGVFSDEEKDTEAEAMKRQCDRSVLEQKYYDCTCIAGAFRAKRDEELLIPQSTILRNLYNDPKTKCADPAKIAGNIYKDCMFSAPYMRSRKNDNPEYCACVANKVAKGFMKSPRLNQSFIGSIQSTAMKTCLQQFK